jgi:hypothetical protein
VFAPAPDSPEANPQGAGLANVPPPELPVPPAHRQLVVGGVIAGLAAVIAVVMFFVMAHPKIRIPDEIAGAGRLETRDAETFERVVEGMAGPKDIEVQAAVYADGADLILFLVAGEDESAITAEQALRAFSLGVESVDPQTIVRLTRLRAEMREGVPYACAPMTGPMGGGLCAWKDPDTVGFVFAPEQPVHEVLDLATASHDAVRR